MAGEVEKGAVVDNEPIRILAGHGRLHAVVQDLARGAADRLQGGDVAAQDRLQILMGHEARPDQPGMAEHQGEQPDDAGEPRLVGERDDEAGEVDLRLLAGWCLEAHLEGPGQIGTQISHGPLDRRVTAGIAALTQLAPEPHGGQAGISCEALAQVRPERRGALLLRLAGAVDRRLEAPGDVFADRLAIQSGLAGDGGDLQALPMKFQDHHEFPKSDHRAAPSRQGEQHR